MNQRDREMMEQIFENVEAGDTSEDEPRLTESEMQQLNVYAAMFTAFADEAHQRAADNRPFFFAPPNNFSYMVN